MSGNTNKDEVLADLMLEILRPPLLRLEILSLVENYKSHSRTQDSAFKEDTIWGRNVEGLIKNKPQSNNLIYSAADDNRKLEAVAEIVGEDIVVPLAPFHEMTNTEDAKYILRCIYLEYSQKMQDIKLFKEFYRKNLNVF